MLYQGILYILEYLPEGLVSRTFGLTQTQLQPLTVSLGMVGHRRFEAYSNNLGHTQTNQTPHLFKWYTIFHIYHEENQVAESLTSEGREQYCFQECGQLDIPHQIWTLMQIDRYGLLSLESLQSKLYFTFIIWKVILSYLLLSYCFQTFVAFRIRDIFDKIVNTISTSEIPLTEP